MTFYAGQILSADDLNAAAPATTPNQLVMRASGSYTATQAAGAKALRIRCLGGAAAGCGAAATGAGEASAGGGGGSGGYSESILDVAAITFPVTVTIGAGGVGSAGAAGPAGGDTSFGTYVIAKGAPVTSGPIATGTTTAWATGGDGGSTSGAVGQIQSKGSDGQPGFRPVVSGTAVARGGSGAQSPLGGSQRAANSSSSAGLSGNPYGGAGSGANNGPSAGTKAGGDGDAGVCIIEPIYN